MNPGDRGRPSDQEAIEARAAAWLAQRDDGFTAADESAFDAWCDADPRHRAALQRLERTWMKMAELRNYRPSARAHPDPNLLAPQAPRGSFRWVPWLSAAGLCSVALLTVFFGRASLRSSEAPARIYATTGGGYERATLEDGSVVELNANSAVSVRYGIDERRITLDRGEAHFTVARNEKRPFWVKAGNIQVRAVGTAFDVRVAGEGIEVLVTAGIVRLSSDGRTDSSDSPTLTAGYKAWVASAGDFSPRVEKLAAVAMKSRLAWQSPRLTFVDMPLGEVIEQFNQRNDLQLGLGDPDLANTLVAGSFAADNVEAFVRLMTSNGDIASEQVNPQLIVLHKVRKT